MAESTDTPKPQPLAAARAILAIFEHGQRTLRESVFAPLVIHGEQLRCPYCAEPVTSENLFLVDVDERWNQVTGHDTSQDTVYVSENDRQHADLYYRITCCEAPVALPDGWEPTW